MKTKVGLALGVILLLLEVGLQLDLAETRTDGSFRWEVERSMDPSELGVDMTALILSGQLESLSPTVGPQPGLVHEPGHGERPTPGYVPTTIGHQD